ncbi:hypothetical protein V2J09_017903 [Rumex salicifolius]
MAVEAVVSVILEKLTDLLIQDSIAFDNVIDQIEDIRIQLRFMRGFLVDPELSKDQGAGAAASASAAWATEYLSVLFSAENTIENYVLSLAAHGNRKIGFFQSRGITLFSDAYDFFGPSKQFRRELNRLEDDIKDLKNKGLPGQAANPSPRGQNPNSNDVQRRSKSPSLSSSYWKHQLEPTNSNPDQEGHTLIGRTEDLAELVKRIKGNQREGIIPLSGPAGSGKTTLVQTIYNRRDIQAHFNCRALVHVPDPSVRIPQLLASILQQVLKSKESGGTLTDEQLISRVKESLEDKTYLVVLDNVSKVQCWDKLRRAFPNLGTEDSKSKVIIIIRDKKEAACLSEQDSGCGQPHDLETLCDDHSWELFIEKSCILNKKESDEPDEVLKGEILELCGGCPFNIVLLGGLLLTKVSTKVPGFDEWKWYLRQADWLGSTGIEQKDIIKALCYNDLPAHSKLCLLYMALFPYEGEIHVRRLQRLWLAEGFIRRIPEKNKEDTVEECFNDLVRRNLIKISKHRSDGIPRTCRLPHALLDYLSPIAHEISLFSIHQESVLAKPESLGVRRVIVDNPTPESASSPSYENLRSYISFNFQRNDTPATEVGNFICKIIGDKGFGVLRVLDLEGVYKPTLPETLKQLFHLRYLGLRWTFIDHLPKSLGKLPYLETLDLKRTYINCLPSSFWKLEHLRHLNLPDICLDYNQKKGHNHLTELRTLVGLIVDDQTTLKDELMHIRKLRELGVTCQSSDSDKLMNWIQLLTDLRSLWLKSKDKMGRPSDIKLKTLSKSSNLSHVSLLGNLARLPALNEFPPNLKVLALSVSRLNDDPMTILSELPRLTVLRLLADSYLGTVMNCPANGFKNLKVLKLWALKELVEWKVVKGGMPKLKELSIRNCRKLKQLPDCLMDLEYHLEELTLTSMPKEFVDEVKQKEHGDTTLTLNDYEFTPLPVEHNLEDVAECVSELDSWHTMIQTPSRPLLQLSSSLSGSTRFFTTIDASDLKRELRDGSQIPSCFPDGIQKVFVACVAKVSLTEVHMRRL